MAPLKISQIISFSSEDPLHPASNLAKQGTKTTSWKCKDEGEKQAWVLCKLAETSIINSIDIGNSGSAFVEVQVGRTGMSTEEFGTLLVASSFMSPAEARVSSNATRVRMFSKDKLNQELSEAKWDLVKFVCTQPFNSHTRYGLSFVTVTGPTPPTTSTVTTTKPSFTSPTKLGAFKMKEDPPNGSLTVGSYFAKRKESSELSPAAAAEAVRRASKKNGATLASIALTQEDKKGGVKRDSEGSSKGVGDSDPPTFYQLKEATKKMGEASRKKPRLDVDLPKRNSLPGESPPPKDRRDSSHLIKDRKDIKEKNYPGSSKKEAQKKEEKAFKPKEKKKKVAKFGKLFEGVTFTISGFQNPLRGEVRGKALEMGAKYKGDWDSQCTHLVCAFANTPKFNQVKGKGKIVTKNWIEESYRKRLRLPWRRFYLDKADRGEESEEEIWDETLVKNEEPSTSATPSANNREDRDSPSEDIDTDEEIERANVQDWQNAAVDDSDENTDDEIERIKKEQESESETATSVKEEQESESEKATSVEVTKNIDHSSNNGYDDDTDDEMKEEIKAEDIVEDEYDADTDIDEEELPNLRANTKNLDFAIFDTYFSGKRFFLYGELSENETKLCKRYIVMFGGKMNNYMDREVDYIITKNKWDKQFEDAKKVNQDVVFIKPEWIFSCCDKRRIVSTHRFMIEEVPL